MFDDELFLNINIYLLQSRPRHNLEVEEVVEAVMVVVEEMVEEEETVEVEEMVAEEGIVVVEETVEVEVVVVDMKVEVVVVDMREVEAVADGLLLVVVVVDLVAEVEEGAQVVAEGDHLTRSDGR